MNEVEKKSFLKFNLKKVLIILLVVFLVGYVFYDISLKVINGFRMQGYYTAINEIILQAESEDCQPFRVFLGEKEVNLVDIDCLQSEEEVMFE